MGGVDAVGNEMEGELVQCIVSSSHDTYAYANRPIGLFINRGEGTQQLLQQQWGKIYWVPINIY